MKRTRREKSEPRCLSMAAFAASASLRLVILTKAWRLSRLTMHVCTSPCRAKMLRSSLSGHLILGSVACSMLRNTREIYVRDTTNEQSSAVDLDVVMRKAAIVLDELLCRSGRRGCRAATAADRAALAIVSAPRISFHVTASIVVIATAVIAISRCIIEAAPGSSAG